MKAALMFGLFVNTLLMYNADLNTRRVRHSDLHSNTHSRQSQGRGRQHRQQPAANYRNYPSQYYLGFNNANREEALMAEIVYLLRELKLNLSAQKQTPYYQPIYVPYAVQLSIPHNVPSPVTLDNSRKPNITTNKPIPEFLNRNNFDDHDDKEYTRPILLKPVTEIPSSPTKTTEKVNYSEGAIVFKDSEIGSKNDIGEPSTCHAAILACCRFTEPKDIQMCFSTHKCNKTYSTKVACDKKVIQAVVQKFIDTYAPK